MFPEEKPITSNSEKNTTKLIIFFIIAFIISWAIWLPNVLASRGIISIPEWYSIVSNLGVFGPLISAFIVVLGFEGRKGAYELLKKGWKVGFNKKWLIPLFFLPFVISGLAFILSVVTTNDTWSAVYQDTSFANTMLTILIMFFLGGPLGEEYGWRGFALSRLQKKWSAWLSSLILGFIWGVWHLPLHFMENTTQEFIPIWAGIMIIMVSSFIYTWLYNNTGSSVLVAMLFHWISNAAMILVPYWQKGDIWNGFSSTPNYLVPSIGMLIGFLLNLIVIILIIVRGDPFTFQSKKDSSKISQK